MLRDRGSVPTLEDLPGAVERDQLDFLLAMFVDMHGKPCAKLIPASATEELVAHGAGFAGFAAGALAQTPADPDLCAVPDPRSYTPLSWQPGLGVVQCDLHVGGEPWPYAPRVILRRQLQQLEAHGYVLMAGAEAEYMLVRRDETGVVIADSMDRSPRPCYDARDLLRMLPHLSDVSANLEKLGWGNYANDHEDANGQFEQNFRYADALTTADRIILFRYMVHALAETRGMEATFMPKPFRSLTGNGLHLHLSLWSPAGDELFADPADPRGLGQSELAYQFIAGLLAHASAWSAITCPTVNSYKRLSAGAPTSGATWAPSRIVYGGNDRTNLLRVPEPGRIENRAVDGSANPYLALAALAAAGLDGITHRRDPGNPGVLPDRASLDGRTSLDDARTMPPTLLHAVDELLADPVVCAALGGPESLPYARYYADVKRKEFHDFHSEVSPWEIERYLTAF